MMWVETSEELQPTSPWTDDNYNLTFSIIVIVTTGCNNFDILIVVILVVY